MLKDDSRLNQIYIARQHDLSTSMPSMISEANDSSWKYLNCSECDEKFENEMNLQYHKTRVHDYGEPGNIYPCDQCGFQGSDLIALKNPRKEGHAKSMYNGRIKQNPVNINFDDDAQVFMMKRFLNKMLLNLQTVNGKGKQQLTHNLSRNLNLTITVHLKTFVKNS